MAAKFCLSATDTPQWCSSTKEWRPQNEQHSPQKGAKVCNTAAALGGGKIMSQRPHIAPQWCCSGDEWRPKGAAAAIKGR